MQETKPHLEVTLKQVDGAMLYMPPLIRLVPWAHPGAVPFSPQRTQKPMCNVACEGSHMKDFGGIGLVNRNHLVPSPFQGCGPIAAQLDPWCRTLLWPDCYIKLFFSPAFPSEHGTLSVNCEEFAKEVKQ